ncbi:CPBP family intramembrane glutamic endopeptidase [Pararhodobacter oceanensis]|uniref:CPBP family intramembrane glutamic endopeptidase n=1 Tax=Pararhodobacter oceanensis TaxID=2172121 RepID=UPI003A8DE367
MTPQYTAYLAPARASNQLWRLITGLMLIVGIYVAWNLTLGLALWLLPVADQILAWAMGRGDFAWFDSGLHGLNARLSRVGQGADPWSLILLMLSFLGFWFGTALTLRLFHNRRLSGLFGRAPVVLRDFTLGVAMMAVIGGGIALFLSQTPLLPQLQLATDPALWLLFLPLALLGILIQTGAEELVFRGYIQGQLAARFASPIIYLSLPTILFGLAHYNPAEMGTNTWLVVATTGLFGLAASDLTARSGSLGLAWGLHFANNVLAILLVSVMGGLDGLALLQLAETGASADLLKPLLISDMLLMVSVWAACRLWLRRR